MRLVVRFVILSLFVGVAALAVYSFYEDNQLIEADARRVACEQHAGPCTPRLARLERTPIRQTFTFRLGAIDVPVTCRHALVLVGPYACQRDLKP